MRKGIPKSGAGVFITIDEAAEWTGLSKRSLYRYIKAKEFGASKPAGPRGGWWIVRGSLEKWWMGRIGKTANR